VAAFADNADIQRILQGAKLLKGRSPPLYVKQQYHPNEIVARQRILQPVLRAAKDEKLRASLVEDCLYIESVLYTVDNVYDVPFDISGLHENRCNSSVAYLGRLGPLTNSPRFHLRGIILPVQDGRHSQRQRCLCCHHVLLRPTEY